MAKTINSDLIRGNINTIILKALFEGDRYGYDIIKEIEEKSHGQYILKQPTLYSCLKRLENQGFIEAYWGEQSSNGGRRKYYKLTDSGREVFKQNQDEYEYSRTVIDTLISENKYNLNSLPYKTSNEDENDENYNTTPIDNSIETNYNNLIQTTEENTESVANVENIENKEIIIDNPELDNDTNLLVDESSIFSKVEDSYTINDTKSTNIVYPNNQNNATPIFDFSSNKPSEEIKIETKTEIPEVNTTSIIDGMLKSNSKSYFNRDSQEVTYANDITNIDNSQEDDEITKKLNELQNSYDLLYKQFEDKNTLIDTENAINDTKDTETVLNNDESYSNGFFKYNKINPEHDKKITNEERLFGKTLLNQAKKNATSSQISSTEQKNISIKDQIKIRNYGKLKQSIEELGENAKLRTHTDTSKDFQKQYYYKDNYLRLFSNGIMFLILLFEIFALYVVGKLVVGANTQYDQIVYISSIALCLLLPFIAVARFIHKPDSKKRNEFNLKSSLIFRFVIAIQIILITYAINIYLEMPITFSANYFITLAIPTIFALNIPFSSIIFNSLRKKEKFSAKD